MEGAALNTSAASEPDANATVGQPGRVFVGTIISQRGRGVLAPTLAARTGYATVRLRVAG